MRLTDEERKLVVELQMEKAHRFLEQADEMCRQKYWDIASNVIIMPAIMQFRPY